MPYLDNTISGPFLSETVARFATRMTGHVAVILHKQRELISVAVPFVSPRPDSGGKSPTEQGRSTFCIKANVTDGTKSGEEKSAFVAPAFGFASAERRRGRLDAAIYVIVCDVVLDYQGLPREHRRTQQLIGETA